MNPAPPVIRTLFRTAKPQIQFGVPAVPSGLPFGAWSDPPRPIGSVLPWSVSLRKRASCFSTEGLPKVLSKFSAHVIFEMAGGRTALPFPWLMLKSIKEFGPTYFEDVIQRHLQQQIHHGNRQAHIHIVGQEKGHEEGHHHGKHLKRHRLE